MPVGLWLGLLLLGWLWVVLAGLALAGLALGWVSLGWLWAGSGWFWRVGSGWVGFGLALAGLGLGCLWLVLAGLALAGLLAVVPATLPDPPHPPGIKPSRDEPPWWSALGFRGGAGVGALLRRQGRG